MLVFVGNSVNKTASKSELTNVQEVLVFINNFTGNKEKTIERLKNLLDDNTGLLDERGHELFYGEFSYIHLFVF